MGPAAVLKMWVLFIFGVWGDDKDDAVTRKKGIHGIFGGGEHPIFYPESFLVLFSLRHRVIFGDFWA
jgi:hypothetical protein